VRISCWVINEGPISAYDLHLRVWKSPRFPHTELRALKEYWERLPQIEQWQNALARRPLHVGQDFQFLGHNIGALKTVEPIVNKESLWFRLVLHAKDQEPIRWQVEIGPERLDGKPFWAIEY
jgi:hypothetical protein